MWDLLIWGLILVGCVSVLIAWLGSRVPPEWGRQEETRPDPVDIKSVEERMRDAGQ